ncbi:MAG: hypothetical protein ABSG17_21520 [Spirochaetia bacterium]
MQLIFNGRIRSLEDLKRFYRKIVMKTHPDALGSAGLSDQFIQFGNFYEEAKQYLADNIAGPGSTPQIKSTNERLRFYQTMQKLEALDMPYAFHRRDNEVRIRTLQSEAASLFKNWNSRYLKLHLLARNEYEQIWSEKPRGPYLKHALALNIRPLLHNVIYFHLTGRELYRKQARQNIDAILNRLTEEGFIGFRDYLSLLIQDMENGAAAFDE